MAFISAALIYPSVSAAPLLRGKKREKGRKGRKKKRKKKQKKRMPSSEGTLPLYLPAVTPFPERTGKPKKMTGRRKKTIGKGWAAAVSN